MIATYVWISLGFISLGSLGQLGEFHIPFVSEVWRSPAAVSLSSQAVEPHANVIWTPPVQNSIKINVDGSFTPSSVSSAIRGVFMDHLATVLLPSPSKWMLSQLFMPNF